MLFYRLHRIARAATRLLLSFLLPGACCLAAVPTLHGNAAGLQPHIMVVLMENHRYEDVIGSGSWPKLNALAQANGLATQYFAVAHPSLPNYLALLSGSTQGVTDDGDYTFPGPAFPDQLSSAGISWRAYMEGLPSTGYTGDGSGNYAKKHNPFTYFSSITNSAAKLNNIVSTDQLASDLANANGPAFMWVTPDLMDDVHDGPDSQGDDYLGNLVQQVKGAAWWRNGAGSAIIIVFDESDSSDTAGIGTASDGGGHIVCLVISNKGSQQYNGNVNHYGLLRTLETVYGVGFLGDAGNSSNGSIMTLLPTFNTGNPGPAPQPRPVPKPVPKPAPKPVPQPNPLPKPGQPGASGGITVYAGPDQAVRVGARVALRGTFHASGASRITYRWSQVSGTKVKMVYTGHGNAVFIAPRRAATLVFRLDGSDGRGHTSHSLTHVRVLASTTAVRPVPKAGSTPAK